MRRLFSIFLFGLLISSAIQADIIHKDVEPALEIKPGETKTVVIPSEKDVVEIRWETLSSEACRQSACIKFKDADFSYESFNGQGEQFTTDGKVTLEFTNIAKEPVTIRVSQIERTCTAELCALINGTDTMDWKVVRIQELKAIQTSADSSYSILQGMTTKGKVFDITLAWWFYEKSMFDSCPKFITRWIENPKPENVPYILAGSMLVPKENGRFILSVDTCTTKGSKFNAPASSEF